MSLSLYNTLTRRKEAFKPARRDYVGFYVCGPTVYDYFHIGNARPFIVFDMVRRFLIFRGFNVRYVMNLTDIDDKIIQRASAEGKSCDEIARRYIQAFFEDIQKLGVLPADVYPRATQHVEDIVALIQKLQQGGVAYEAGGDVFFSVSRYKNYSQLSGKRLDDLQAGARISVDERKQSPLDFVLWKASKPGEPYWESPWGRGRPGWHIECSAMAMKYLGETFDIHAGGQDLIFPHHENERAQSEAATGHAFARYWLHNGFLDIQGEKMAKSAGNFITARELAKKYSAGTIRLFFLQKHYRSPIDFSEEGLQAAAAGVARIGLLHEKLEKLVQPGDGLPREGQTPDGDSRQQEFGAALARLDAELIAAMEDDFNTPMAIGKIFDLVRFTNKFIDESPLKGVDLQLLALAHQRLNQYNGFLGIIDEQKAPVGEDTFARVVELLLELRQQLRQERNYALADQIRRELAEVSIVIEDGPEGSSWRREEKKK